MRFLILINVWLAVSAPPVLGVDFVLSGGRGVTNRTQVNLTTRALENGPGIRINSPQTDPSGVLEVSVGERIGFTAVGSSVDGQLFGTEWYLDGEFLGAQHVSSLPDASPNKASFWRGIIFRHRGNHLVEVEAFDHRGRYSETQSWQIIVVERPRLLYVDQTEVRIASNASMQEIVHFVTLHGFNQVALYRLHLIFPNSVLSERLPRFVEALHQAGVARVFAVVGSEYGVDQVQLYMDREASTIARFDGILTEYEFWQQDVSFSDYQSLLIKIRIMAARNNIQVATYVGWFDRDDDCEARIQARIISSLCDLVLLHAYVGNPQDAYRYLNSRDRLKKLGGLVDDQPTKIWPLFSAQSDFMGNWIGEHQAYALSQAEERVLDDFRRDSKVWRNHLRLSGFAWYASRHLETTL